MKPLQVTLAAFVLVLALLFVATLYVKGPGDRGAVGRILTSGKLLLFKYSLAGPLSPPERKFLYLSSCTRKCHSRGVMEDTSRTAREWDVLVGLMSERAGINKVETEAITAYLQENFLSTVPTMLSEELMAFLKKYLWRFEFGDNDLFLDLVYVPELRYHLLSYLGASSIKEAVPKGETAFVVFINTHQGVVPPWDLSESAILKSADGKETRATRWQVIYEDSQGHHKEGMLFFPKVEEIEGTMEVSVKLPGLREKSFQWTLPVPPYQGKYEREL